MKISEMTNDQATNALIRLSVPFGNICDDPETVALIDKYVKAKDAPFIQTIGRILPEITALALKAHKDDLYEIVGTLMDKTVDDVAKMNFLETIKAVRDSYDEVLHGFFTSYARGIKRPGEKS